MRKTTTFGAAMIALAASGWIATAVAQAPAPADPAPPAPAADATPAPAPDAKPAKPMHHKKMMPAKTGKLVGTAKGDSEVEDLNAKSLDAAKAGKSFAPPTTPMSEPAAHAKGGKTAPAKHMMKKHVAKPKAPAPDAAAPAPDAAPPAPAPK